MNMLKYRPRSRTVSSGVELPSDVLSDFIFFFFLYRRRQADTLIASVVSLPRCFSITTTHQQQQAQLVLCRITANSNTHRRIRWTLRSKFPHQVEASTSWLALLTSRKRIALRPTGKAPNCRLMAYTIQSAYILLAPTHMAASIYIHGTRSNHSRNRQMAKIKLQPATAS